MLKRSLNPGRPCRDALLVLLASGFPLLLCQAQPGAAEPSGYGDGIFCTGPSGYASLPANLVQDLDYRKDLSLEVALNIQAHAAGGRWAFVLAKKNSPLLADPGFALSMNQGQFKTLGQQLCATVADGAHQAALSSRFFQGTVHAVLTWNVSGKELRLFVNGALEGSVTNVLINPANLRNPSALKLAAPSYGQPLQRDILLARLWNRQLSAREVAGLWTHFHRTGQHALPADFDRIALISEWLMLDLRDATHVNDNCGSNHFQLRGTAGLWQAHGPLVLQFPPDNATNVSKSVLLKTAGGLGSLSASPVRPLQYLLQLDETNTFSSPALKSSGWMSGDGAWKPGLKPATRYYWRAQVRDSSPAPTPSRYCATQSFVTLGTNSWFVRPGVYSGYDAETGAPVAKDGVYGTQDGASYRNAWNGLGSIRWGPGGVEPGDTLYVCGRHLYTLSNHNWLAYQALVYLPESGYSSDYPLTIRMDWPADPGTVWGVALNRIDGGAAWTGPDANGVYSSANLSYSADYCLQGTNLVLLARATKSTWSRPDAASFTTNGIWYVKTPDGRSPAGRIGATGLGYQLNLGRSSYIRFYRCRFYNAAPGTDLANYNASLDTQTRLPRSTHITFDGCDLRYNAEITLAQGNDDWAVRNSELAFGQYGVYAMLNLRATGANHLTVENNYFHDLGTERFPHLDGHAIGIQGGEGHLIQGNRIERTGSAIEFWTSSQPMRNHIICYNFIKDIHTTHAGGAGITISGDRVHSVAGLRTGFKIYYNIILNTGLGATEFWQGAGIDSNSPDYLEIWNNSIYRAPIGIQLRVMDAAVQGSVVNNLIIHPQKAYLVVIGSSTSAKLLLDYNLFYPATDFASGFTLSPSFRHDSHSLLADPLFAANPPLTPEAFRLSPGSPALKAGIPVALGRNFEAHPLAPAQPPNIGAQ